MTSPRREPDFVLRFWLLAGILVSAVVVVAGLVGDLYGEGARAATSLGGYAWALVILVLAGRVARRRFMEQVAAGLYDDPFRDAAAFLARRRQRGAR
jgi:hypothetical protein